MIPDSFIEELKYRCDIESIVSPYTNLKRTGRNLKGLCPFHSEKTPSFVVYPENGSFFCFGCGAGGDIVTFVRMAEHLEYTEAIRFLAQKVGMPMPEDAENDQTAKLKVRILELNREAARFFHATLISPKGAKGLHYLRSRGLSDKTIRRFGLGYAPEEWDALKKHLLAKGFTEHEMLEAAVIRKSEKGRSYDQFRDRVMFPIIDLRGGVIGFGGRIMGDGRPKYLNSADTPVFKKSRGLFAMNLAKATKQPRLMLCEGYMDAISVHQAGFDNAVATLGTALTAEQARLIAQYTSEVVICYDSDEAGQKATARANQLFEQTGVKVRVLSIPDAKDPDEYIKKFGAARFNKLVEESANSTEYAIEKIRRKFPPDTDDGKVGFLKEFCVLMSKIQNRVEADYYIGKTAADLNISREAMISQVDSLRRRSHKKEQKKFDSDLKIYGQDVPAARQDLQRSANMRYALAEDKLIAALLKNPDYGRKLSEKIRPEQFVTDFNKGIYSILLERINSGRSLDMISLSADLSIEQMNRVSYLLATAAQNNPSLEQAKQYADIILEKQRQRTNEQVGSMNEQQLREYIEQLAAGKK